MKVNLKKAVISPDAKNCMEILLIPKKHFLLSFFFVFVFISLGFSQLRNVKGKVLNQIRDPLEGVSVTEKNSNKGVTTDKEGNYSINV